ncbi:MAG TPA: BTAD domain-containing putative transcriptional regulator [Pseudonocardiaceae bacterium]|nr:BTAD domain-containing putative transcriptional regulator [Pseudonocardiaceae bacterium]
MTTIPDFRLLGSMRVELDGKPVDIGHARQQTVLAALLVNANTAVATDELIDRIWGPAPPHRPKDTLHTYLTRLRKTLPAIPISRHGNSYQLTTPESTIDLHHFRQLVRQAAGATDEVAAALFEQALALWRGEPFTGLDSPWLTSTRAALLGEQVAAQLDHNDVRLRLGQHAGMLVSLAAQSQASPLDERLAGQLMLALYRSGRQADALRHYQHTRARLGAELGVDPASNLQQLHQDILTSDPAVQAPGPVRTATPFVPRQLPARPRSFIGRANELAELSEVLDDTARPGETVLISALSGTGGIGKTWLALHWAYENIARFPDGQLFVNLRGFDPSGKPTSQDTAVRAFLTALGVGPGSIPLTTSAALTLYRNLLRGRRMLVVLDNAADTAQVEPLLPASPTATVLITSRDRLDDLDTKQVYLDTLPTEAARALLSTRLGEVRLAAEPEATADLLASCAGLPLALSIVAGRALENPDFPLALLAAELHDETTRLALLDEDTTTGVRAVLSWSHAALRPAEATAFALLGLAPGPDISLPAAADLLGIAQPQAEEVLAALERVSLIQQPTPTRFRMHDLVRLYATDQADHLPTDVADAALRRLLDFYRHTAAIGNLLLDPFWDSVVMDEPGEHCHPIALADPPAATAWFTAEEPNLQAARRLAKRRDWHRDVWHLAWNTMVYRRQQALLWERLRAAQDGVAAAEALGDPITLHLSLRCLGACESQLGDNEAAVDHVKQALRIATEQRDIAGQAHALHILDMAVARTADSERGLGYAEESLRLFRMLEQPVWVARKLNSVGWHACLLGLHERALRACTEALALTRAHGDRENEAATLDSLGMIAATTGEYQGALSCYQDALAVMRDLGASYRIADILDHLAEAYLGLGQTETAREQWLEAQRLYRSHYRYSMAEQVQAQLATLDKQSPQTLATLDNTTGE